MMSPNMTGVSQGMANMSLQYPGISPAMTGGMQMMGPQRPVMASMGE